MVNITYSDTFKKSFSKIKNPNFVKSIKSQIRKVVVNPLVGKPMRYERKGTRELYVSPFRISYIYDETEKRIYFTSIYHKDLQ